MPIHGHVINVNIYRLPMGNSNELHDRISYEIQRTIANNLTNFPSEMHIDIYRMNGGKYKLNSAALQNRIVIFFNAGHEDTVIDDIELSEPFTINGIENDFKYFIAPTNKEDNTFIMSPEGIVLAEWNEEGKELFILFDLFDDYNPSRVRILEYIMKEFNELVWFPKTLFYSWKHTNNREQLTKHVTEYLKQQKERLMDDDMERIRNLKEEITNLRHRLKSSYETLSQKRVQVEQAKEQIKEAQNTLISDLDKIVNHEKVKDLRIEENIFYVYTEPLHIFTNKGKRYYGGEYQIKINLTRSDIKFYGGTPRYGYFSENDPHPHVSGVDGVPCLGSANETIAELSSQAQLYALVMVCIDFLESVNISDPAGEKIKRWDEIDEDETIIQYGEDPFTSSNNEDDEDDDESRVECSSCGDLVSEDDIVTAYDEIIFYENDEDREPELVGQHDACLVCIERYYFNDGDIYYLDEIVTDR